MKKAVTIETHRYSLDVGKDLRDLINERKKQAESKNSNCSSQKTESREEIEENMNNSPSTRDDTFYGTSKQSVRNFEKMSDESFEALEMMCDKTASDPDSTLFQYLHSDNKEKILAGVKKRSTNGK